MTSHMKDFSKMTDDERDAFWKQRLHDMTINVLKNSGKIAERVYHDLKADFSDDALYYYYVDDWDYYNDEIVAIFLDNRLLDCGMNFRIHETKLIEFIIDFVSRNGDEEIEKIIAKIKAKAKEGSLEP